MRKVQELKAILVEVKSGAVKHMADMAVNSTKLILVVTLNGTGT
jgi:hypothetical protein